MERDENIVFTDEYMDTTETIRPQENKQVIVELPVEVVKALKVAAIQRDSTMKAVVESALREYLQIAVGESAA